MGRTSHRGAGVVARRRRAEDDRGFTLIEVVVAIALFAIFISGIAAMVGNGLDLARNNRNRSIAANLASRQLDEFRSRDFDDVAALVGQTGEQESVEGVVYDVTRDVAWVAQDSEGGACDVGDPGALDPRLLRIVVRVEWAAMGAIDPVQAETVLSPPVGSFDPTLGNIAVRILDRDAGPGYGHPVTVTGPETPPVQYTINDNNEVGCAFFAGLEPGTYTVELGTLDYVDRQAEATPSQVVNVSSGTVSSVQFDYDLSAEIDVTLAAPEGGTIPVDVPLTLGNSSLLPLGSQVVPGTGTNRLLDDLFPFADGYQVWAGACADADPEGEDLGGGGAYWPGGLRDPVIAVDPGDTAVTTVNLPTLQVSVTQGGVPLAGATVRAVHGSDTGCDTGAEFGLGTTDASGVVLGALPYGDYSVEVDGEAGTWPVAIDPTLTSPFLLAVEVAG